MTARRRLVDWLLTGLLVLLPALVLRASLQRGTPSALDEALLRITAPLEAGVSWVVEGIPKTLTVTDAEIREALQEPVNAIVDAVRWVLERTPPELSADIVDKGIVLSGGGAQLKNLDVLLREETGLPVMVCENPQLAVVLGTGKVLDELSLLREIALR